jgi:DNA adenine methylase
MAIRRPVLRYHGGKWMLAPWIIEHFPPHRVYVESFAGGGSVLMRKARSYAEIYNDASGDVVNVFRVIKDEPSARRLTGLLIATPFARDEFYRAYEDTTDPVERALRTIIRSHMGHGSTGVTQKSRTGFRANSNRSGTTPAHDWVTYPAQIKEYVERLRGVVIENRPAADVTMRHDSEATLHYVDPPYVHATRGNDKRYVVEMMDVDHRELADLLHGVKGMVVLSGYDCPLYQELYGDWRRVERSALADGARPRTESLWLNPPVVDYVDSVKMFTSELNVAKENT